MTDVRVTHIGGPTTLIEVGGWRLLTDPTFDPPGRRYRFGWGTSSRKTTGPALAVADLPPVDAVLLSHDHHGDNLDMAGRTLLPTATPYSPRRPEHDDSAATPLAWRPGRPHTFRPQDARRSASPRHPPATARRCPGRSPETSPASRCTGRDNGTACCGSPETPSSTTAYDTLHVA